MSTACFIVEVHQPRKPTVTTGFLWNVEIVGAPEDSPRSTDGVPPGSLTASLPLKIMVEVGSLSHYLQGFIHPRWLFGVELVILKDDIP